MAQSLAASLSFCREAILGPQFTPRSRNRLSARSHAALLPGSKCTPFAQANIVGRRLRKSVAGESLPLRQSSNKSGPDACLPSRRRDASLGIVVTRARVADAPAAPALSTKEKARSPLLDADVPDFVKDAG